MGNGVVASNASFYNWQKGQTPGVVNANQGNNTGVVVGQRVVWGNNATRQ